MSRSTEYASKLFRKGNILKALTLAIRGIHRTWEYEQAPVTLDSGWTIYATEIALLDDINPKLAVFLSGVLGAALVTLGEEPAGIEFWERVNRNQWSRRKTGELDPVGWLLQWIDRHCGDEDITQSGEYLHFLFQAGLAAFAAWNEGRLAGKTVWLSDAPSPVDIPQALEHVRKRKGLKRKADGFRPQSVLMGRIPLWTPTVIEHANDLEQAVEMAKRVQSLDEYTFETQCLPQVTMTLEQIKLPAELAAPGALAAALVSLAQDPGNIRTWKDVAAGHWSHDPHRGSDLAGVITRSIRWTNQKNRGVDGQAILFARILMAFKTHRRLRVSLDHLYCRSLSSAKKPLVAQLNKRWQGIDLSDGPRIHSPSIQPLIKGASEQQVRPPCQKRRGQGRGVSGRRGERIFEQFHEECSLPWPGKLVDRTRDQVGYDYEIEHPDQPLCANEVKLVNGNGFSFGELQWQMAGQMGEDYYAVLVEEQDGKEAQVHLVPNPHRHFKPVRKTRMVVTTEYYVSAKEWKRVVEKLQKSNRR